MIVSVGVYIRLMFYDSLRVPPLRRVPFGKQPQKEPKRPCPSVRPSLRSGSLSPVPLRGHAVTGHPWPNTALPASCREAHYAKPTLGLPKGPVDQKQSQNAVRFGSKKINCCHLNRPDDSKAPCQPFEWNRCVVGNPAGSRVSAVGHGCPYGAAHGAAME